MSTDGLIEREEEIESLPWERYTLPIMRRTLAAIADKERKIEQLREVKRSIIAEYDAEIRKLGEQCNQLRENAVQWIIHENGGHSVSFPDVGFAHKQHKAASVRVDPVEAEAVWGSNPEFQKSAFDIVAFRRYVVEAFEKDGEILEGTRYEPERDILVFSPAK